MRDHRCPSCQQVFQPDPEIYTRVDPSVQLEALESVVPPELRSGRFKATDKLIRRATGQFIGPRPVLSRETA